MILAVLAGCSGVWMLSPIRTRPLPASTTMSAFGDASCTAPATPISAGVMPITPSVVASSDGRRPRSRRGGGGGAWATRLGGTGRRESERGACGRSGARASHGDRWNLLGIGRRRRATMGDVPPASNPSHSSTRISARIAAIQESATLAVDAKAKALKAAGENVIGFGAGEPDFPTPASVVEAAIAACRDPRFHHYSPTPGLPELREAIAFKTKRDSGVDCAAAQVVVTNGGKHAVYNTFHDALRRRRRGAAACAVLDVVSGDHHARGRRPGRARRHRRPTGSGSPSNSSKPRSRPAPRRCSSSRRATRPARSTRPKRSRRSARWALDRGMWVVTDEIYEHLTYDGHVFSSMPGLVPEIMDTLRDPERRRQDLRDDGLAGRLDDRPARRRRRRDEPPVALHVERLERRAGGRARGRQRRPLRRFTRCASRSRGAAISMYELLSKIDGVSVLAPQGAFYCFPSFEGVLGREIEGRTPAHDARALRAAARRGEGRDRSRRGVRCARIRPAVVRARRRRSRRRCSPDRRPARVAVYPRGDGHRAFSSPNLSPNEGSTPCVPRASMSTCRPASRRSSCSSRSRARRRS